MKMEMIVVAESPLLPRVGFALQHVVSAVTPTSIADEGRDRYGRELRTYSGQPLGKGGHSALEMKGGLCRAHCERDCITVQRWACPVDRYEIHVGASVDRPRQ